MICRLLVSSFVAVFLVGCSTSQTSTSQTYTPDPAAVRPRTSHPIHNVAETPLPRSVTASEDQVGEAIVLAASARGWKITSDESGMIEATVYVRDHMAAISIPYSENGYAIEYKDSENLNYSDDYIHRNYNKWIILLDRDIQQQLLEINKAD